MSFQVTHGQCCHLWLAERSNMLWNNIRILQIITWLKGWWLFFYYFFKAWILYFANILCHQIPVSASYCWKDQSCQSDDQWTITGTQITSNQHVHSNPSGQLNSPTTVCILETKTTSVELFSLPLFLLKSHRNDKPAKKIEICFHIKLFPVNAFTYPLPNMIFMKMKYSHKKTLQKAMSIAQGELHCSEVLQVYSQVSSSSPT